MSKLILRMIFRDSCLCGTLATAGESPDLLQPLLVALRWRIVLYLSATGLLAKSFDLPLQSWPMLIGVPLALARPFLCLILMRKSLFVAGVAAILRPVHPLTLMLGFVGILGCLCGGLGLLGARSEASAALSWCYAIAGLCLVAAAAVWEVFRPHPLVLQKRQFQEMFGEAG